MADDARIGGFRGLTDIGVAYSQTVGSFGIVSGRLNQQTLVVNPVTTWYTTCREQFHSFGTAQKCSDFFYVVNPDTQEDVAHFMYHIERWLKLENKSWFKYTEKNSIIWIEAEKWWTINPMRYQFFTICLRAALNWRRRFNADLRQTLNSYIYARETPEAVDRFLAGYTWYTGNVVGWKKQFFGTGSTGPGHVEKPTVSQLNKLLVLPDYERERRIKESAYFKWEKDGCPTCDSNYYLQMAAREVDAA